eukprot:scaffold271468_cov32-Tisochrysis_lutea.AAC.6
MEDRRPRRRTQARARIYRPPPLTRCAPSLEGWCAWAPSEAVPPPTSPRDTQSKGTGARTEPVTRLIHANGRDHIWVEVDEGRLASVDRSPRFELALLAGGPHLERSVDTPLGHLPVNLPRWPLGKHEVDVIAHPLVQEDRSC